MVLTKEDKIYLEKTFATKVEPRLAKSQASESVLRIESVMNRGVEDMRRIADEIKAILGPASNTKA